MDKEEIIRSPDTERQNRIPPGQTTTSKWPVLQYGPVQTIDINKWTLKISGLVEEARILSFAEFMALPMTKVYSDIHCVTGWSKLDNLWEGVSTSELHNLVTISPEAKYVVVQCAGYFTTNLETSDFFQPDAVFAIKHNNEILTPDHGYPVRLVVPRLYFWKSAKWVTGIEFREDDKPGFWEIMGYHNHGDPWKEERYSRQK